MDYYEKRQQTWTHGTPSSVHVLDQLSGWKRRVSAEVAWQDVDWLREIEECDEGVSMVAEVSSSERKG